MKADQLFNRLEKQRNTIVEMYNLLSPEQRAFNPQPDAWNLLQVMRHLVTAEKQSMVLIQRRITKRMELPRWSGRPIFRARHALIISNSL